MFTELLTQLAKMEASVRAAFVDVEGRIAAQRTRIQTLDESLLTPLERVEALAKKAETTVKGRLEELSDTIERRLG